MLLFNYPVDILDHLSRALHQYTTNFKRGQDNIPIKANFTGNNLKSMHVSVEASLRKLRTNYIDLLYVHWWDYETSVEEVLNGLHNLVTQGKESSAVPQP